eukprot:gene33766-45218_t
MSGIETKGIIYYLIRRGWYGQLASLCQSSAGGGSGPRGSKGKGVLEPLLVFWRAFALSMMPAYQEATSSGSSALQEARKILENSFQARRDMQYPVTLALLHCHRRQQANGIADYETIETLSNELAVAEDVTKEAGLILAARFNLFTGELEEALRLTQKVLSMSGGAGTSGVHSVYELEAVAVEQWVYALQFEQNGTSAALRKKVMGAESLLKRCYSSGGNDATMDIDAMMVMAKCKQLLGLYPDLLNVLNQVIAMYPNFYPALGDKTLLLATAGEWDQALDTAQRLLDLDAENLDALKVIAAHSFTQESQPHDSVQKLEDLDASLKAKESGGVSISVHFLVETAKLFASICCRQPRALQMCAGMLERIVKLNSSISNIKPEDEAVVLSQLGYICIMQGPGSFEKAMKCFRESTRKDESNIKTLEGMVLCQLAEGAYDDAEAQIELL